MGTNIKKPNWDQLISASLNKKFERQYISYGHDATFTYDLYFQNSTNVADNLNKADFVENLIKTYFTFQQI